MIFDDTFLCALWPEGKRIDELERLNQVAFVPSQYLLSMKNVWSIVNIVSFCVCAWELFVHEFIFVERVFFGVDETKYSIETSTKNVQILMWVRMCFRCQHSTCPASVTHISNISTALQWTTPTKLHITSHVCLCVCLRYLWLQYLLLLMCVSVDFMMKKKIRRTDEEVENNDKQKENKKQPRTEKKNHKSLRNSAWRHHIVEMNRMNDYYIRDLCLWRVNVATVWIRLFSVSFYRKQSAGCIAEKLFIIID